MQDKLKNFIQKNKAGFDDVNPSKDLWQNVEKNLPVKQKKRIIKLYSRHISWAAAAIIFMVAGALIYKYVFEKNGKQEYDYMVAGNTPPHNYNSPTPPIDRSNEITANTDRSPNNETKYKVPITDATKNKQTQTTKGKKKSQINEELYHYAKLIEIKQNKMQALQNKNPQLYSRFAEDLQTLQTSYKQLSKELNKSINNERVLQAMMQNLKMQSNLLNKQLEITQQLNDLKNGPQYKSL